MKKLLMLSFIICLFLTLSTIAQARTKMDVDCPNCLITFTISLWTDVSYVHVIQIKEAVDKYWNPKIPLKYYNCEVKVVPFIESSRMREKKKSDSIFQIVKTDLKGGGATLQSGKSYHGGNNPQAMSHVIMNTLPNNKLNLNKVAHELGHVMGLDDLPTATDKWDEKGIKDDHIKNIIKKGTYKTPSGTVVGWGPDAECCKKCTKSGEGHKETSGESEDKEIEEE